MSMLSQKRTPARQPRFHRERPGSPSFEHQIQVRPGWLVLNQTKASGGVSSKRLVTTDVAQGRAGETTTVITRRVDNRRLYREMDVLRQEANYACRDCCIATRLGWYVDQDNVDTLRARFATFRTTAEQLNREASRLGSERSITVSLVLAKLDFEVEDAASEIRHTVVDVLTSLHDILRTGMILTTDPGPVKLRPTLLRAQNLDRLAGGEDGSAIRAALTCVEDARAVIRDRRADGLAPLAAAAFANFTPLRAAIERFEDQ
jgi:hypothetical protein